MFSHEHMLYAVWFLAGTFFGQSLLAFFRGLFKKVA